jgi:glutamate dehydrogenase
MKAQMVKNGVIVPVGAKGGFVVKRPPEGGDRQALVDEAIRCYRMFLSGMLDITDNQVGAVVPPADVVRYDDDDPYLVVAADKGTATFSDIANDRRRVRLLARRRLRLGRLQPATTTRDGHHRQGGLGIGQAAFPRARPGSRRRRVHRVGIGDMSGDVFGNGMLLSDKIKLLAAFDHRDILLDPNPDPAVSFKERQRLFALPRSTWQDYDKSLLSPGGQIVSRAGEVDHRLARGPAALGLEHDTFSPTS